MDSRIFFLLSFFLVLNPELDKIRHMKYLFIVQGDGRGHLTQAISLSEMLRRHGHEVIEVLVGKSKSREIPTFFFDKIKAPVSTYQTPSFIFKKNKKNVHIFKTFVYNIHPKRIQNYNKSLEFIHRKIKENAPDIVINFYEMLAGLAYLRFRPQPIFIGIAHQYLIRHPEYKFANGDKEGMLLYRLITLICSIGSSKLLGLSFYPMAEFQSERLAVVPPLLRNEVLQTTPTSGNFVLGYILNQGFEDEVRNWHKEHPEVELHFFWDNKKADKETKVDQTLTFHTLDDKLFLDYMASCKAYISTAGFESICEAFYLHKPVMMIPAHTEQEVNAKDAASTGMGIEGKSFDIGILLDFAKNHQPEDTFKDWLNRAEELFMKHLALTDK